MDTLSHSVTIGEWTAFHQDLLAAELLLQGLEFNHDNLGDYWLASVQLMALLQETNAYLDERAQSGPPTGDRELFTGMRHRLRLIFARSEEISADYETSTLIEDV